MAFAIDGKISESHERAFAENGGPRKMGFVKMLADDGDRRRMERLIGRDAVKAMPDATRLRAARKEEAEARAQVRTIEPAVQMNRTRNSANPAISALATARERHVLAVHELDSMELRPLACYEQNELLHEAVAKAHRSLVVTSAGLQPTMLTQHVLRDIDRLISDRASVAIASFLKPQAEPRGGDHYDPLAELALQLRFG